MNKDKTLRLTAVRDDKIYTVTEEPTGEIIYRGSYGDIVYSVGLYYRQKAKKEGNENVEITAHWEDYSSCESFMKDGQTYALTVMVSEPTIEQLARDTVGENMVTLIKDSDIFIVMLNDLDVNVG